MGWKVGTVTEQAHVKTYSIRKNWVILFISAPPVIIGVVYGDVIITQQAMNERFLGFSPVALVATYVGSVILISLSIADLLTELLTKYTSDGVEKLTFRGIKSVKWKELTSVKGYSKFVNLNYLELRGEGRKIRINTLFYRDIEELIDLIRSQAPTAKWE